MREGFQDALRSPRCYREDTILKIEDITWVGDGPATNRVYCNTEDHGGNDQDPRQTLESILLMKHGEFIMAFMTCEQSI